MKSNKQAALYLAKKGFKVFPIKAGAKAPPLLANWPKLATNDERLVNSWWGDYPDANIGIHCAGMIVIDVDSKKGGDGTFNLLREMFGLPETLSARTPSGGTHHFYQLPEGHPGVSNSVEFLGPGVDVRSTNGYVVAAGSSTGHGSYVWVNEGYPINVSPPWLVKKLGQAPARTGKTAKPVADADAQVVDRAAQWLKKAPRSVKGAGGDQTAYKVACYLRDLGVSQQQATELMRGPNWDYGCGWRDGWLEAKPIASAYRYASGEPGSKVALPTDFPIVSEHSQTEESKPAIKPAKTGVKLRIKSFEELTGGATEAPPYIVKGLLYQSSYTMLYGDSGLGKTFVALDVAYHVAAGKEWRGHRIKQGAILYVGFEAYGGLKNRAVALRQRYGDQQVPLFFAPGGFDIKTEEGRQALGQMIADMPEKPKMIVFDTFAYALAGGDENSTQDTNSFHSAVQALIESTGACVLIVHHPGKDASKGARGSSTIHAAVDTEFCLRKGVIESRKQRDADRHDPIGFKLKVIPIGIDEDGDPITSCVVEPAPASTYDGPPIKENAKLGFEVLKGLAPNNASIPMDDWREACKDFLGEKGFRQRFLRLKIELEKAKLITIDGDKVKRRMTDE